MLNLKAPSLEWALRHARRGDTDIFPPIFEFDAIQEDWLALRDYLVKQNVLTWPTRARRECLLPKGPLAFRTGTQLDPLDFLLYSATVYEIGEKIEARRITTRRGRVFSSRFAPDSSGRLYNPNIGYQEFQAATVKLLESDKFHTVVVTDISDFYHRIYHHRLENALNAAAPGTPHVTAIMKLLDGWCDRNSYSLPIGPPVSRLLAELTLSDVDSGLEGEQIRFLRYNDDYRIFSKSDADGYRALGILAQLLHGMHGLTLQPGKTDILSAADFRARVLPTEEDMEITQLRERFREFIEQLGLPSEYEELGATVLTDEQTELLDSLNLSSMLQNELARGGQLELKIVRFVLNRMAQLGREDIVDDVLDNVDRLFPVFDNVIRYIKSLSGLTARRRREIGRRVLGLTKNSIVGELEYHRMWAMELFVESDEWNSKDRFQTVLARYPDHFTRRNAILAMGRSQQSHWFSSNASRVLEEPPWPRRAFLAAMTCLPPDRVKHFHGALESRLDPLEVAVAKWARQHPFRS
ncbi:MAG: RNA-directed DNA polymerase [Gemmatimonadota bacterium]|nr:RNA-directed DNA polymerase [Gemmatimonadota bacterium]